MNRTNLDLSSNGEAAARKNGNLSFVDHWPYLRVEPYFIIGTKITFIVNHIADGSSLLIGRGSRKGAAQTCISCHGTGMQVRMHQLLPGMVQQVSTVCHSCQGQGQRINQKDRCKACGGRKILRQKKILEVHIDKGEREVRISIRLFNDESIKTNGSRIV